MGDDHAAALRRSVQRNASAKDLAEAFDRWFALDQQLQERGPKAVSPEQMSAAWRDLLQAHEEWSLSR